MVRASPFPYSLDGNSIRDNGAGMLADALKVNNMSLQTLRSVADSSIIPCMSRAHTIERY